MKLKIAILGLVAILSHPALAQYGVSNQRDSYGNLVRDRGTQPQAGVNQSTPNNSGAIRNPPIQRPINPTVTGPQIIRSGAGTN